MSLWKIAWRSIQQRSLASTLTAVSMALGVALVVTVLVVHGVLEEAFTRGAQGYHLVVGKKGSQLQLVLNTVYHLQESMEPLPYSFYKEFIDTGPHHGKYAGYVQLAIPYCLGDNYQGFRVVGTVPELFDKLEYSGGQHYRIQPGGRNIKPENFFEAVVGAEAARKTGLKVGEEFQPTHGLGTEGEGHKHDAFTVVGILEPTGTANDRALFINIEGFYLLDNHAKPVENAPALPAAKSQLIHAHSGHGHDHAHEPLPEEQREVTAILVLAKNDIFAQQLQRKINEGLEAQAASPIKVIQEFFAKMVSDVSFVLLALTVLIMVEAGVGIMVSIYNSMSDRRREIAVMRALGAGRRTVLTVVLLESILLSVGGGLLGFVLGHGLVAAVSPWAVAKTGVSLGFLQFAWYDVTMGYGGGTPIMIPYELVLIPCLVALASLVGFLPAMSAYRTDVAKALTASP
jgi:putative ABC transport system permease protein